jgi:CRP-like cAMP-binding protein
MLPLLGNLAYGLMACAFVMRDALRLRTLLVVSQLLVIAYTLMAGVPVIAAWNVLYISVNAYMAMQLLNERRAVTLPAHLRALYDRHFSALSPGEFLRWWALGERVSLGDAPLTRDGERPEWLYFLLDGRVRVSRGGETITELPAGYFVGEMSLVTDRPANADVHTSGPVAVQRWPREGLAAIRERDPKLWTRIQSVIGHDLVEKIHRGERSGATGGSRAGRDG